MQNKFKSRMQISDDHCGPAVLQMLLENLGIEVTQENITKAAGVETTIHEHGTRIDQLALAVCTLAPTTKLWYKDKSSVDDLLKVLNIHGYPVGVEWQGLFWDTVDQETEEDDEETEYGHYSIISNIDTEKKEVIIVDPYKDFVNQNRIFNLDLFIERWWDTNEVLDKKTGKVKLVEDVRLFFTVVRESETFPKDLKMKSYY